MLEHRTIAQLAAGFLLAAALGAVPAAAQTAPKAAAAKGTGIGSPGKVLPVAEYYEGGQEALYAFIAKELKYPPLAKRNRVQGQCIASFTLDTNGMMQDLMLVKQVGAGTGEEALRVVRMLKFKKPELPVVTSIPIVFKLGVTGSNATEAR